MEKETYGQMNNWTKRQIEKKTIGQMGKQTNGQADKWPSASGQTDKRKMDKLTKGHIYDRTNGQDTFICLRKLLKIGEKT